MNLTDGITGRIKRSIAAGLLGQIINVLGRLALVPLYLSTWGIQLYGEWLMLSALAASLAISDFGGSLYFVNRLTSVWQEKKIDHFIEILSTGLFLFLIIPLLFLITLLITALAFDLHKWLSLSIISKSTFIEVLTLLGLQIAISLPQGLLLGIYRAIGKQATSMMLANGLLILQLIASGVVLFLNGSIIHMAISQALSMLIFTIWLSIYLYYVELKIPLLKFSSFRKKVLSESLKPSLHFFTIRIAQIATSQLSIVIIGKTLGSDQVPLFSTLRMLANFLMQFLGLITHSAWPEITKLDTASEYDKVKKIYLIIFTINLLAVTTYFFFMALFGKYIFELWTNGEILYISSSANLFNIYVAITTVWTLSASFLMATNRHSVLANSQIIASLLGLIGCWIGAISFHMNGAIMGIILGEGLLMIFIVLREIYNTPWGIISKTNNYKNQFTTKI